MKRMSGISVAVIALLAGVQAQAQQRSERLSLPIAPAPFAGVIRDNVLDSTPTPLVPVRAPQGAPNILLFMSDDVGFAMSSAFGGPVPTPNMDRLAAAGQRYNRFHTTGICSPSRAALLTGRNHHHVGAGYLSDLPTGFPGYDAHIPPSTATIAQTLRLNGYSTAMFGKHHNVPGGEETAAGPFDQWPTGLGFDYFYGFVQGDTDQWNPNLYRGSSRLPDQPEPAVLLDHRLADDMISWVHNQKAAAPDKPFFVYFAPGSTHAPHQAPAEDIARFRGKFDQGWDVQREEIWRRQLAQGIIPPGTKLTVCPDGIPAWASLTAQQKAFAARTMEVAAAMLAYQDAQLGRVIDELQRMGEYDRTLFAIVQGDNGAATEVGPRGTVNELGNINGLDEDDAWLAANVDRLGGRQTYPTYPAGWALAMNTPLRWTKQYASMLGAIRNGMILSWQGHVAHPDSVCAEFGHLVDMAPTLLDAAGIPAPDTVAGVKQKPFDGQSLIPSLAACRADRPRTQYFEIGGKAGLYHDGWFASLDDGRKPWEPVPPGGPRAAGTWTLYDLDRDFSQADDVSAQNPDRMKAMIALWQAVAAKNDVMPLDHRFGPARGGHLPPPRTRYDYWGKDVSVSAMRGPMFAGRSFTVNADLKLDRPDASGVVLAVGSRFAGWSLYLDKGRPVFTYARSTRPEDIVTIAAKARLPKGATSLHLAFTAEGVRKGAKVAIGSGDDILASGAIARTFVLPAGVGEMLDVGRDTGVTVTDYRTAHGEIEGDVPHVVISF
jgi:arylsulfatase A-like enzyme